MSQWIRNYNPTEIDADEWDNILVLRDNGQKSVHNWEDYVDDGMQEQGCAWMPLPQSDIPQSVSVTIEVGNKTYMIKNNGLDIEIDDGGENNFMGQPTVFSAPDTITGILDAVDGILQLHLNGNEDCGDPYFDAIALAKHHGGLYFENPMDMDQAVAFAESMAGIPPHVPMTALTVEDREDEDCGCEGVLVNDVELQGFIDAIRGKTADVPASKKPWKKKLGSYDV